MAENWVNFTDAEVLPANSQERQTIKRVKARDDLADICGKVTDQIRQAYTLSNREVGDAGTIPDGLKGRAIAIALWRFVSEGVPKMAAIQTRERQDAYKEANDFLDQIAKGAIGKAASPSISPKHRRFRHEDGI